MFILYRAPVQQKEQTKNQRKPGEVTFVCVNCAYAAEKKQTRTKKGLDRISKNRGQEEKMRLGLLIREYRNKAGKPVEDILDYVGTSRRTYYLWESGIRLPDMEKLEKLARFFAENIPGEDYEKIKNELEKAYKQELKLHISTERRGKGIHEKIKKAEEEISETILRDMREKGIPPSILAEKTGIKESTLMEILTGFRIPSKEELEKIAEALGQPVERYLVLLTEEEVLSIIAKNSRIRQILRDLYTLNDRKREAVIDIIRRILEMERE